MSAVMLSGIMLSVVVLNVAAPDRKLFLLMPNNPQQTRATLPARDQSFRDLLIYHFYRYKNVSKGHFTDMPFHLLCSKYVVSPIRASCSVISPTIYQALTRDSGEMTEKMYKKRLVSRMNPSLLLKNILQNT
jgi:hypothetical protein